MVAFTYRMPAGIPGALSRGVGQSKVEAQVLDTTDYPTEFGVAVTIDGTTHALRKIKAGDVASSVTGIYVRPYPIQNSVASDPLGTATPPTSGIGNQLKSGYISVKLRGATAAAKQGAVYVRLAGADGTHPLGGFEAASDVSAVGAAGGGNTGNGTIGTVSGTSAAKSGVYNITMTGATTFNVTDPDGIDFIDGATGTQYTKDGVSFKITVGGTPMVAGDTFTVTVAVNTAPLPDAYFTGPADADGNVEIAFNL